jgi:hypothetical protein
MNDNPIYDDVTGKRMFDPLKDRRPSPWPRDEIAPRPDGSWCEDRVPGGEITDRDGVE